MEREENDRDLISGLLSFKTFIAPYYIKGLHYIVSLLSVFGYYFIFIKFSPASYVSNITPAKDILLWLTATLVTILISKISCEMILIKFKQYEVMKSIEKEIRLNNINLTEDSEVENN